MKYGRLTIIEDLGVFNRRHRVRCSCDCGAEVIVQARSLASGNTSSCGCLQKERTPRTHRLASGGKHPLYLVWRGMKTRCYNPKTRAFKTYGARGIKLCAEWREDPETFVRWALQHGWQPRLTINREDNDGDYEPSNCTFISKPDNNRHRHAIARKQRVNDCVLSALSLAV